MTEIVLVGVDGSDTAFKAASRAASIAAGLNAELAVLTEEGLHHAQGYLLSKPAADPSVQWPDRHLAA